jgi:hypothetical protein
LEGENREARPVDVMLKEDLLEEDARVEALDVAVEVMEIETKDDEEPEPLNVERSVETGDDERRRLLDKTDDTVSATVAEAVLLGEDDTLMLLDSDFDMLLEGVGSTLPLRDFEPRGEPDTDAVLDVRERSF